MILKAFDLFSGGGGFRQGTEKAGIEIIAHCEIDKWAEKFYKQAFDTKGEVYFNDATKIDTRELPNFDILLAGFPCQAFSIAGKRQGFNDTRGTMFFEVARILQDKRPGYFILENVKGLLSHDNGKTFQTILKILSDIGIYTVEWALLNSKYFGVPQNRERVFIVGYPREYGIGKIFPIEHTNEVCIKTGKIKEEIHNITSTLKALITIFNFGEKSQMIVKAGDAYPSCMLGDIVLEIPHGISVINLSDLPRFERCDGTAHLIFEDDFKGAIYAIDWLKNAKS